MARRTLHSYLRALTFGFCFFLGSLTSTAAPPAFARAGAAAERAELHEVSGPRLEAPSVSSIGVFGVDSFNPIHWVFNNKARMVQLATVGMAIGLFIMLRK
jgi:hypothetical protein